MKNKIFALIMCCGLLLTGCGDKEAESQPTDTVDKTTEEATIEAATGEEISNSLFTITLPAECSGLYVAETSDEDITIFEKEAKDAGFGGMVFTICARKTPSEYAGGPYMKKGELTDADGNKYDVVLGTATEVQWDYEKYTDMPEAFAKIYDASEDIVASMVGNNGATFEYGAGTKGEDLYGNIILNYKKAFDEGWDATVFEQQGMSPEFYSLGQDSLSNIGFAYYDTDKDGVDELFVGSLMDDELKGSIYDIYTIVDGLPTHVVSGTARNRFYVYNGGMIVNEYSSGALENGQLVYCLQSNMSELVYQWGTKIDAYTNEDQPWFISYTEDEWENVTEDEFLSRQAPEEDFTKLDFKPLSDF